MRKKNIDVLSSNICNCYLRGLLKIVSWKKNEESRMDEILSLLTSKKRIPSRLETTCPKSHSKISQLRILRNHTLKSWQRKLQRFSPRN